MAKEVETEYKDVTLNEAIEKLHKEKNRILDEFAKAYLAETGLMPSDVELVTQQSRNGDIIENVFYFRRRNGGN